MAGGGGNASDATPATSYARSFSPSREAAAAAAAEALDRSRRAKMERQKFLYSHSNNFMGTPPSATGEKIL